MPLISSETSKSHLPSSKIFFLNDKSRSSTGVAFAPLVFFLALGLVLDAWLKPVLETTLDVPGLLASLTSGTGRPKGLCSAFDGSRMISIRLTHIYLSILNIYSYSYNIYIYILYIYIYILYIYINIYYIYIRKKLLDLNPSTLRAICGKAVDDAKVETC